MATNVKAYKDHRPGSAKGQVHELYDRKGRDAAIALALKLKKAETTARSWCYQFGNTGNRPKKAAAAATSKKGATKKSPMKTKKAA